MRDRRDDSSVRRVSDGAIAFKSVSRIETATTIEEAELMLKREVWNNVFTLSLRSRRLLLFTLAIMLIAGSVGELKKTQGQSTSCNSSYKENTAWDIGFQGEVTVVNNGPAINGWTVTFTFPTTTQTIYELWNGVYTQTGQNVTVTNKDYHPS